MRAADIVPELRRRKVLRVATVYVAFGLATIYAADVILPRLSLPEWTVTLVIVLVGLGLPLALGLAWAFDLDGSGFVRTGPSPGGEDAPVAAAPAEPTAGEPDAAIVVLPFSDMSPAGDHEYFTDGLTEEIIADLAGIRALRVISRTSAMCLKGTDRNAREIGRDLGVRYILEGSVRVAGPRLRITAQLIDARTDAHLWADRYDGALEEVFDVQERVAREIVEALDLELTGEEEARLSAHPVVDPRAFELYARIRHQLRGFDTSGASELLGRAIEIEGETLPLRALAAWAKVTEVRTGSARAAVLLDEAETEARELERLAPDSGLGASLLGFIAWERGELAASVRAFQRALDFQPNDGEALFFLGVVYNAGGSVDAVERVAQRLLTSDPLNPNAHMLEGIRHWFIGEADRAGPHIARGLALDPANLIGRWTDGYTRALLGDVQGAREQARWLATMAPDFTYTDQLVSLAAALDGDAEAALATLAGFDPSGLDGHHLFHVAESFAVAGETDRALELLAVAVDRGFYPPDYISEYCPFFASLRDTDEFRRTAEKAARLSWAFRDELSSIESAPRRTGS